MDTPQDWTTRHTLLVRARNPLDTEAWSDFVRHYQRFIYHLLHRMHVNPNDVNDLSQMILLKLWKSLPTYDREKAGFRTWLGRVVRNAALDFFSDEKRQREVRERAAAEPNPAETSPTEIERMIEQDWISYLSGMAIERVRQVFSGEAVNVFTLSLEDVPVDEIARRLNLTKDSVYTLKSRVRSRFLIELRALREEMEPGFAEKPSAESEAKQDGASP